MRSSFGYALIAVLSAPLLYGPFRLRARGREHLPAGGYVLAANHVSNLDPWPLGLPLWPARVLRFMAKAELYRWPLSWVLRSGGAFPVRRGESDREAVETAIRLCREGHAVAVFPEGTRRKKARRTKVATRPRTGAARIALEAGVPLVPAAIGGVDRLARLGPLRVVYGAPLELGDLLGHDPHEAAAEATRRLMERIGELESTL